MARDAASSHSHYEDVPAQAAEAGRRPTPLPFDPVGKTHYTAEEFRALLEGASPPTDERNRLVLAAHPDRPATQEELMAFVEELWALYRAETGNGADGEDAG